MSDANPAASPDASDADAGPPPFEAVIDLQAVRDEQEGDVIIYDPDGGDETWLAIDEDAAVSIQALRGEEGRP